jgi:hypothetical protein
VSDDCIDVFLVTVDFHFDFYKVRDRFVSADCSVQIGTSDGSCYDLNEFNSGCNERQRLEGEKGIINELVKRKEYRSITYATYTTRSTQGNY